MANQAYLTANSYLGLAKETTRGTVNTSATAQWIPVSSPQITPQQKFLRDEALRGSPSMVYDQVAGVRNDDVEFKAYAYADSIGVILQSLLGATDTPTGTGPYTHTLRLLNSASTGSQPSSYSIQDFDGANYFLITGAQADSMTLAFGAEVAAEATMKFIGNPYTSSTTASAPFASYSTATSQHPIPTWDTVATIGGTGYANVMSGEIKLERKTQPIFTMNGASGQSPFVNFAGPLDVSGKLTLVVSATNDPFTTGSTAYGLTRSPQTMSLAMTDPNSPTASYSLTLTGSSTQFQMVKRVRGKEFVEIEMEFTCNANTTDGGGSVYSPLAAVLINGVAAGY